MRTTFIELSYLIATVLFILGLRSLTKPESARRGMQHAALGMMFAFLGTLVQHEIVRYDWIVAGLVVGTVIGVPLGVLVPMTAMPQRIAIALSFGALAATLVGVETYVRAAAVVSRPTMAALGFEVLLGTLTVAGSLIATGKLQEVLPSRPLTFRGQNAVNFALFAITLGLLVFVIVDPVAAPVFYAMIACAFLSGLLLVLPIGGADMPVVIALLNSYSGLASAATGFAIGNNVLIIAGALDGSSGFILSLLMSKAMNRSFANVLFGAFGAQVAVGARSAAGLTVRSITPEDAAIQLAYARSVIVVPGYGMAVALAQHQVRVLAELVERRGGEV